VTAPPAEVARLEVTRAVREEEVAEESWEGAVAVEAGTVTMTIDVVVTTDVTWETAGRVRVEVARAVWEGNVVVVLR